MRLKDRNRQVPEGMFFYVPETKWRSAPWSSFSSIVDQVIQHRMANPFLAQKHGWSTDRARVESDVDEFVAAVCSAMGWTNFIVGAEGSPPPPKSNPPSPEAVSKLVAAGAVAKRLWLGLRTGSEWIDSGEPAVPAEQSEARAAVCVACPLNKEGDWTRWFVKPAAAAFKLQIERLHERKLTTSLDEKLGICEGCDCVIKVKVHTPMSFIKKHLTDEVIDRLRKGKDCWQIKELAAS